LPFDANKGMFVTSDGEEIPPAAETGALTSSNRLARFRSVLFDVTGPVHGEFVFGVFRSAPLRQTPLIEGYIGAEKVMLARLSLKGRFREVPAELFFRRYHPTHAGRAGTSTWKGLIRIARNYGPERRVILFPLARQIQGYLKAVVQAEVTLAEKARCGIIVMAKVGSVVTRRVRAVASKLRESGRRVADRS
jgi:hypothetical protein